MELPGRILIKNNLSSDSDKQDLNIPDILKERIEEIKKAKSSPTSKDQPTQIQLPDS